ncbi:MAG: low affinity iron permease family protein [Vampirovibrionales bacterium]|nr:low affinity iron permease family protein [Vampirovibrionales bacterium]
MPTPSKPTKGVQDVFTHLSTVLARWAGSPQLCFGAMALILLWGLTGPLFNYSDTWQLAINTTTNIITFLMVFLIQNTQNRESEALHLKVDELIRANVTAHNRFMQLEDLSQRELDVIKDEFEKLAQQEEEILEEVEESHEKDE